MAEYKSKHARLSFYVEGKRKQFAQGRYVTDDKAEIKVLDGMVDAKRVDQPKEEAKEQPKPAEEKAPSKPKQKPKSSDK